MKLFISFFLLFLFMLHHGLITGASLESYHYKDHQFKKIEYNDAFFKDVLLAADVSNTAGYEKEKNTIKKMFPESSVSPFHIEELDKIDTKNKTVIIIFNDRNISQMDIFLKKFVPIKPFADMFMNKGDYVCGAASFAHIGENSERFLIVKEELKGKGFPYVLNFLINVKKSTSYANRANCYKPAD